MEENKFYIEKNEGGTVETINISDVNALAQMAVSLKPEKEVTEAFGYAAALDTYFRDNDGELKDIHKKLMDSKFGSHLLCITIELCLLEKLFRTDGITTDAMELYNRILREHKAYIETNNNNYSNGFDPEIRSFN